MLVKRKEKNHTPCHTCFITNSANLLYILPLLKETVACFHIKSTQVIANNLVFSLLQCAPFTVCVEYFAYYTLYYSMHRVCTGSLTCFMTCFMNVFPISVDLCIHCFSLALIPSGFVKQNYRQAGKFTHKNQSREEIEL